MRFVKSRRKRKRDEHGYTRPSHFPEGAPRVSAHRIHHRDDGSYPLVFISFPLIAVLRLPASESRALLEGHPLAILLASRHSQLGAVASAPPIAVTYLVALDVIHATLGLALGFVAALLVFDGLGWRAVSSMFDRELLVTGTRS